MLKRQRVLAAREIRLCLAFLLIPCLQHFSFTFHFTFFRSSSADADKFFASRFFFYPRVSSQLCTFRDVRRDVLLDFDIQFLSRFFPTSYYTSLLSLFRSLSFFGSILNSFAVPSKSFSPIFHRRPRISNFFLSLETLVGFCFALLRPLHHTLTSSKKC